MILAVISKSLREAVRRPLYLATLVGIPMALMFIFGAALPTGTPEDADAGFTGEDEADAFASPALAAAAPTISDITAATRPTTPTISAPASNEPTLWHWNPWSSSWSEEASGIWWGDQPTQWSVDEPTMPPRDADREPEPEPTPQRPWWWRR